MFIDYFVRVGYSTFISEENIIYLFSRFAPKGNNPRCKRLELFRLGTHPKKHRLLMSKACPLFVHKVLNYEFML